MLFLSRILSGQIPGAPGPHVHDRNIKRRYFNDNMDNHLSEAFDGPLWRCTPNGYPQSRLPFEVVFGTEWYGNDSCPRI